ncbi:sickle tail protein homolog isoform X2 [Esox lucius]|uniref:sickle tail protein homolog isoform X2 n=1 Tax=Esox lucius TaxID=8010 RepID=UPI00147740ED|nr:sickle tail protein homolog isoform X2 [Esox lucius]
MTSKSSRLGRPSSAGSKQPSQRKECQAGSRSCMLRVGERLMRAGSEGNLHVVRPKPAQRKPPEEGPQQSGAAAAKESGNNNPRLSSPEDLEHLHRQQNPLNQNHNSEPRSPSTVPRRYTIGGQAPRSARDPLTMQHAEVERKKEVFLEHLKKRYPHHAAVIMGHQDHLREHTRSPQHSASPQLALGEQLEHLSVTSLESLEAMSEGEGPATFTRGCRARASLPVARSANQTKDRSPGVIYLQYAEETKQVRMPDEISSGDTIRALFVSAFPHLLTVKMLESPTVAVYIKDDSRNMYHELTDVRNITPRCCLKVYHKDPEQAFNRSSARPNYSDSRIPREMLYGSHSPVHTLHSTRSPVQAVQRSMSPPTARSMPSSPSRIPFGSRVGGGVPGSSTLPRASISSGPPCRSATPCPSAILERRDVRPDEDLGGKSMTPGRSEGIYAGVADPYALQEGRLSMTSSQGGSHAGEVVDMGGVHRAKCTASYTESQEHRHQQPLYRQKSRRYGESQGLPPLGTKTPPPSPHRGSEVRMINNPLAMERGGPVRQSLRRESNGNAGEVVNRTRDSVSSVSSSPVFMESPQGHHGDRLFQGPISPSDPQTSQRMKAMEQQIASLAGLVQHALAIGPAEIDGRTVSRSHVNNSAGVSPVPPAKSPALPADGPSVSQGPPPDRALQGTLTTVRRNVTDLRQQLQQLRQLQMQNQDSVTVMLRRAEQELAAVMSENLQRQRQESKPGQRQRVMVDEERHKYLTMEDRVLAQLRELEDYVDRLKRDSGPSAPGLLSVTLRDVEEGAVNLRRVGEALARLKGEFPSLQGKMRAVLRVEVEAVRFLKEEPQKMDSMLKRVKALTEALSALRRRVTENHPQPPEPGAYKAAEGAKTADAESDPGPKNLPTVESPKPQPRSSVKPSLPQPQGPNPAGRPDAAPASPVVAHRVKSSPVSKQPCHHAAALPHHPSPPLTPTFGRDSPTVAKVSPRSRESSPALQKRGVPWCGDGPGSSVAATRPPGSEEIHNYRGSIKNRGMDMEVAERAGDLEEERPPQSSATPAGSEFEQILEEAKASLMRAIPDLEVTEEGRRESKSPLPPLPPPVPDTAPDAEVPLDIPLPDEVDAPQLAEVPLPEPPQPGNVSTEATVQASPEPHRPMVEKPRRPSVERETKNSSERVGKSPPPPPPRRLFPSPSGPGLTTGRSGEVIFTTRMEVAPAKDYKEEAAPQPSPKTTRQPPEVKPKPHTTSLITASTEPEEEEDEEDEDEEDTFMKELQVFQKYTLRDVGTKCVLDLTSTASQVRQIETDSSLSANHPKNTSGSPSSRTSLSASPKFRQQPAGSPEKPEGKTQKLPDSQRQFRQTF